MKDQYFIRSYEHQLGGRFAMWWGPNECGYTQSLDEAGLYSKEEADEICERANYGLINKNEPNEVAYPAEEVLAGSVGRVERIVRLA